MQPNIDAHFDSNVKIRYTIAPLSMCRFTSLMFTWTATLMQRCQSNS